MKDLKKYIIALSIVCAIIIIVQIICKYFGLNINQGILIEIVSVILALLVSLGIINKEGSKDENFSELKEEIKKDLQENIEQNKASKDDNTLNLQNPQKDQIDTKHNVNDAKVARTNPKDIDKN